MHCFCFVCFVCQSAIGEHIGFCACTGQEEIETSGEILKQRVANLGSKVDERMILPIYSTRIFENTPPGWAFALQILLLLLFVCYLLFIICCLLFIICYLLFVIIFIFAKPFVRSH
jgi:hypothetical protein